MEGFLIMTAALPQPGASERDTVREETAAWLASAALRERPGLAGIMRRTADALRGERRCTPEPADVPEVIVRAARYTIVQVEGGEWAAWDLAERRKVSVPEDLDAAISTADALNGGQ